jgi:hypothetical protein
MIDPIGVFYYWGPAGIKSKTCTLTEARSMINPNRTSLDWGTVEGGIWLSSRKNRVHL